MLQPRPMRRIAPMYHRRTLFDNELSGELPDFSQFTSLVYLYVIVSSRHPSRGNMREAVATPKKNVEI